MHHSIWLLPGSQGCLCNKCFGPPSHLLGLEFAFFKKACDGLKEKYPPWSQALTLGPRWWWCLVRFRWPAEESMSLGQALTLSPHFQLVPFSEPASADRHSPLCFPAAAAAAAAPPYHDGAPSPQRTTTTNPQTFYLIRCLGYGLLSQ